MVKRYTTVDPKVVREQESNVIPAPEPISSDISIDSLLSKGLNILDRLMKKINIDIVAEVPTRECVQNLKDCMAMLHELKKKEAEILKDLSEDQLMELLNKDASIETSSGQRVAEEKESSTKAD